MGLPRYPPGTRVRVVSNTDHLNNSELIVDLIGLIGTVMDDSVAPWVLFDIKIRSLADNYQKVFNGRTYSADHLLVLRSNDLIKLDYYDMNYKDYFEDVLGDGQI